MPVIKDIVAVVGEYEKNGEKKKSYRKVGEIHQNSDGGEFILLDKIFNPGALAEPSRERVLLSLFEPKAKESTAAPKGTRNTSTQDDDIPF